MNLGTENKKQLGILAVVGVLALFAIFYIYSELSTPAAAPPPAPVVVTRPSPSVAPAARQTGAAAVKVSDGQLDPTLHMEAMLVTESLVYSGSGRNIFSANSAPTEIPKLIAKVRMPVPIAPVRTAPAGPPPPPPIPLKFFGTETNAKGDRRAFLLHDEDVFLASPGEIVQRRYRVISVDAHSIVIEDIANNNRQTLPLLAN